jgi:myo-inositol-1(or 4)-monophosphatase
MIEVELSKEFPNIPYFSEEGVRKAVVSGYQWIVDSLDGTVNYFSGIPDWGVSIALSYDSRPTIGVIFLPANEQLFSVTQKFDWPLLTEVKEGNQVPIKVSKDTSLANSQVWTDWVKERHGGADHQRVRDIFRILGEKTLYPQIRLCCTASMMAVAQGKIAGYVHPGPEPFDIAAAGLIVEKAGGKVTDMQGNPWSPFSESIVATNGLIHEALLEVLNK